MNMSNCNSANGTFFPNRYYEFPNGKHNIHLRYADEFNEVVSKFIQNK